MKRVEQIAHRRPTPVISDFLGAMKAAAGKTYAGWSHILLDGVKDVAPEGSEAYRQIIEIQPLDDFYFAGVVAMEAAKIRRYLDPETARDMLGELAAQVDTAAERTDRVVSDFVFFLMGRLELESGVELLTMPYDKVVHVILQRIGLDQHDLTRPLMNDFAFRHSLGEPLARKIPEWWKKQALKMKRQAEAAKEFGHLDIAAE